MGDVFEAFAGSAVQLVGDVVKVLLAVAAEVGALVEELTQQAVGVFVAVSLPAQVPGREVDLNASRDAHVAMSGHLLPLDSKSASRAVMPEARPEPLDESLLSGFDRIQTPVEPSKDEEGRVTVCNSRFNPPLA
ncbi:hypothetical protein [uncultured Tessaracoccus sp.]|uniref:hypothetical protein n=1 Tax=uncultured Tessaracoccus sp. TaxID=905023 RepID=UPI00260B7443|nr:hypothetical protein [uncultured Tessaracoccus sp.]